MTSDTTGHDYTLLHPVAVDGGIITAVNLRRLKGRDLIAAENEMRAALGPGATPGDVTRSLFLVARAAGQPIEVIEEMDAADTTALMGMVGDFF